MRIILPSADAFLSILMQNKPLRGYVCVGVGAYGEGWSKRGKGREGEREKGRGWTLDIQDVR